PGTARRRRSKASRLRRAAKVAWRWADRATTRPRRWRRRPGQEGSAEDASRRGPERRVADLSATAAPAKRDQARAVDRTAGQTRQVGPCHSRVVAGRNADPIRVLL